MDDQNQSSYGLGSQDNQDHDDSMVAGLGTPPDDPTQQQSTSEPDKTDNDTDDIVNDDHGTVDDLLSIKQQALTQLAPLLNNLDQSAEDRFKTTMMMIQASDNQSLIKDAYDAAKQITDEKAKAQALLDIVNEINYFSQSK